jgi:hypothetical protein
MADPLILQSVAVDHLHFVTIHGGTRISPWGTPEEVEMTRRRSQITAALMLCSLTSAVALAGGFRGNEWGATKSEVKATEKYTLHHDMPGELAYFAFQLAGVDAGLVYKFENDGLVSAYFMSRHRTPDPEEDWADHETWRKQFDEHFGEHSRQEWVGREGVEVSAGDLSAVTSGRAELVTHWTTADARIRLVIQGEDGAVTQIRAYFEPLP